MSLIELLGLPDITFEVVGIPVTITILFFLVRHLMKSPVLIALINKRRDCHISDNEVRIAKLNAKSKEKLARINRTDFSDNSHLRVDRE